MGEVFVALLTGAAGFEKLVVIKRILPHLAEDPRFISMFLSEARLTASMSHPNIAQVFELGEIDGDYYLAMEYLEGVSLSRLLKKRVHRGLDLRVAAFAIPKSQIFTPPSWLMSTFEGDMSRWTMPSGASSRSQRSCA